MGRHKLTLSPFFSTVAKLSHFIGSTSHQGPKGSRSGLAQVENSAVVPSSYLQYIEGSMAVEGTGSEHFAKVGYLACVVDYVTVNASNSTHVPLGEQFRQSQIRDRWA